MEGSKTIESEESPMVSVLEDGRIVKFKDADFSELVNGEWKPLSAPMTGETYMNSRVLSESELKELNISE